jgi:glycosyltransferase involved in cell wall biosynthesis
MKILHLISSGGMYGAEAVILNLSHGLQQAGDESIIALFDNASLQLYDRASEEGLPAVQIPCQGRLNLQSLQAIRDAVKEHGIDVLHAHGYKADLYAWAALRGRGVPILSTCHNWIDSDVAVRIYGALDRWVLKRYARVVAVSAEVEERLRNSGVRPANIRRIRNGIDLRSFASAAAKRTEQPVDGTLRVGLVGRLSLEKGVDIFVEAAAIVARSFPEARFVVIGEGPERAALEQQIRTLGMEHSLQLAGHKSAMAEVYAGLDLLVSASRMEGLPIALLEGMASGLPVVATAVGDVPQVVRPEETGLLVPPADAPALAAAMQDLIADSARRLAMGRGARCLVEREYSAERMTEEYRTVYRETMQHGGRQA